MASVNKNENQKYFMYFIGGLIVIGIIILVIYLTRKKDATASGATGSGTGGSQTPTSTCVPYTQQMYDRDLSLIRSKCYPKLLVPITGIGLYNNCVTSGKAGLPFINNCGK